MLRRWLGPACFLLLGHDVRTILFTCSGMSCGDLTRAHMVDGKRVMMLAGNLATMSLDELDEMVMRLFKELDKDRRLQVQGSGFRVQGSGSFEVAAQGFTVRMRGPERLHRLAVASDPSSCCHAMFVTDSLYATAREMQYGLASMGAHLTGAIDLRARYAVPGTDLACGAARRRGNEHDERSRRWSAPLSAYLIAMRCVVLTWRMAVPSVLALAMHYPVLIQRIVALFAYALVWRRPVLIYRITLRLCACYGKPVTNTDIVHGGVRCEHAAGSTRVSKSGVRPHGVVYSPHDA
eukprot:1474262-Rhodomonas_salina.1